MTVMRMLISLVSRKSILQVWGVMCLTMELITIELMIAMFFVSLLDISKAFGSMLFKRLVDLKFPANLIKLLLHWYLNQTMNVRWKHITTSCFPMLNGTRQGGVLSPA